MPRIARVVVTKNPHHITQRGNYKQKVFSSGNDYALYLRWLSECSKKYNMSILAFCLMPNHVHFLAIPYKEDSLAKTFNTCHMKYSQYYNKKNKNKGHLWQGRFYSCALDQGHTYEAARYIENNPIRANIAKKAEDWKWSSAGEHLNIAKNALKLEKIGKYIDASDWKKYLTEKEDNGLINKIKANTLTGRPSGSNYFVAKIEKMFGRRLRPLPEGRPKKDKN